MVIFGGSIGGETLVNDAWVLRNATGVPTTPVSSIAITSVVTTICITKTLQLTAVAKNADGNIIEGVIFLWTSGNEAIATVDKTGLVKGISLGTVAFTASYGGIISALFTVTITADTTTTTPPPPPGGGGGGPQLIIPAVAGQVKQGCFDTFTRKGVVQAETLIAWGGAPLSGYTWTLSNLSTFPAGTTVEPLTGIFKSSGGTIIPGTHTFNMTVSDGSTTANGTFTFIAETASSATADGVPGVGCGVALFQQSHLFTITLPDAKAGSGYGASLYVTVGGGSAGGTLPLTWNLGTGTLPQGLVIDTARGVVRGTPFSSAAGQTFNFTITVRDHNGKIASCGGTNCPTYRITVN
jgi:hypothetical protein